ncbi:HAD family hydrolase [Erwinia oleae]|uniref:HAD family hydrolase n=1 Tax=Erwinia oleae TaxID=796334 RepID=UPI00054D5C52|nr:HAD-IA family hydrolase [Erwinia oleae]
MKRSTDLVIFDCDGVLVDSEIIGIELTLALLNQHGAKIGIEEFTSRYSGLAWDELITKIQSEKKIAIPSTVHQQFYPLLMAAFAERLVRIANTVEIISEIPLKKCICSNSGSAQLDYMLSLTGLKDLFSPHIYSAVDLGPGRSKPQPDIFLHAARELNAALENTLVIEDSVHGVIAAKKAGMYAIGFTGGAHTTPDHQQRLTAAGADVVIHAMTLLPGEIARFAR